MDKFKFGVSAKFSLGDYDMVEYFGAGETSEEAFMNFHEMYEKFSPKEVKKKAHLARSEAQKAAVDMAKDIPF